MSNDPQRAPYRRRMPDFNGVPQGTLCVKCFDTFQEPVFVGERGPFCERCANEMRTEYSNELDWDANLALSPRRREVVTVRFVEGDYREFRV